MNKEVLKGMFQKSDIWYLNPILKTIFISGVVIASAYFTMFISKIEFLYGLIFYYSFCLFSLMSKIKDVRDELKSKEKEVEMMS
jgi:hypothetical protein